MGKLDKEILVCAHGAPTVESSLHPNRPPVLLLSQLVPTKAPEARGQRGWAWAPGCPLAQVSVVEGKCAS